MALVVKLALKTGMRKGEILALEWDDVDFSTNRIEINHSLSYTKKFGYQMKSPKTEGSVRKVVIPEDLQDDLKKHIFDKRQEKLATEELWYDYLGDLVFSTHGHHKETNRLTVFGKQLHLNAPNRWLNRFYERVNNQDDKPLLKKVKFHDFRHTFATDLISKGGNINKISKYLGHSTITTTVDTYGHLLEDDTEIEDLVNNSSQSS